MKKETKEVLKWLIDHLSHYRNQLAAGQVKIGLVTGEKEEKNAYEAINFLNSLPEIESHLCGGGYIQDRNGTPCCDGDEVIISEDNETFTESEVGTLKGMLQWDKDHFSIVLPTGKKSLVMYLDTFAGFEKVEE